jgi:GGDEF domain-containing protein
MISFGKFLAHKRDSAVGPLKTLALAVSGTALRSGSDYDGFQQRVESAAGRIAADTGEEAMGAEVEDIIAALEHYNASVEQQAASQQAELRAMIAAGLETVAAIGSSSDACISQFRSLETRLESASAIEDLRLLRGKLLACLTLVRNETVRMQMDSQKMIRSLKATVLRASAELQPGTDATTGLPGPAALGRALKTAPEPAQPRHVAVFVLDDLAAINGRFGRAAGDDALRVASEYLKQGFGENAHIARWNGPSFVVLAEPGNTADEFQEKARALTRTPFTVPLPDGPELKRLKASLSWMVQTLPVSELTEAATRNIDAFVSKHIGPTAAAAN